MCKLILGTMTFGPQVSREDSRSMVQRFLDTGYTELDTAYVYNDGETERILGDILKDIPDGSFRLATKAHPRITGRLDADAVNLQLTKSLDRLGQDSVDIFYLHFPDSTTPVEEALDGCVQLHAQGKFKELGLSNFPTWMVVDIWHLCKERGWPKPTVYQGLYNGISRNVESELIPALRKLGMRFYAFNPLAGGLLSGKHTDFNRKPEAGRFTERASYRKRYWRKSMFEAVQLLVDVCRENDIQPVDAALRWLAHHSTLDASYGDGIIIGASKMHHLDQNLAAAGIGALPVSIIEAFDAGWSKAKCECPEYFRIYSK